jgi:hypothetical protein
MILPDGHPFAGGSLGILAHHLLLVATTQILLDLLPPLVPQQHLFVHLKKTRVLPLSAVGGWEKTVYAFSTRHGRIIYPISYFFCRACYRTPTLMVLVITRKTSPAGNRSIQTCMNTIQAFFSPWLFYHIGGNKIQR